MKTITWIGVLSGIAAFFTALFLMWQPASAQRWVVNRLLNEADSSHMKVTVGGTGGSFFRQFILKNVSIRDADGQWSIDIPEVRVVVGWTALARRRLFIRRLLLVKPVMTASGPPIAQAPETKKPSPSHPSEGFSIARLDIEEGRIQLPGVRLDRIDLDSRLSFKRLDIGSLRFNVGEGQAVIAGQATISHMWWADLTLQLTTFPLDDVLRAFSARPSALQLPYSGQGRWRGFSHAWQLETRGALGQGAIDLSANYDQVRGYKAALRVQHLPVASVWKNSSAQKQGNVTATADFSMKNASVSSLRGELKGRWDLPVKGVETSTGSIGLSLSLVDGKGPASVQATYASVLAEANGQLDLVRRRLSADFQGRVNHVGDLSPVAASARNATGQLSFKGRASGPFQALSVDGSLDAKEVGFESWLAKAAHIQLTREAGDRVFHVAWQADDVTKISDGKSPLEISTLEGIVSGTGSLWDASIHAKLPSKTTMDYQGRVKQDGSLWHVEWDRLVWNPAKGGAWQNAHPGRLRFQSGEIVVDSTTFTNGQGSFTTGGRWAKAGMDVAFKGQVDPALLLDITSATTDGATIASISGTRRLNADVRMTGAWPNVNIDGSVEAFAQELKIPSVELTLKDVDIFVKSQGKHVRVERGSAKTKKGTLALSGQSTWPAMDFQLEAKRLPLKKGKQLSLTTNARLALEGTLQAPVVRGGVHILDGTYVREPVKKKTETSSTSSSALWTAMKVDVRARWDRDVWYRDGLSKIETSADIHAEKESGEPMLRTAGRISLLRGTYDAYGRQFEVTSGEIVLVDIDGMEPTFNIAAHYQAATTDVYLDVTGTPSAPRLQLRSNPPLPQPDIVSVIVVGRPLNEFNTSGNSSGQTNAQALAGNVVGSYLSQGLRKTGLDILTLDVIRTEPSTEGTRLTVGRYLMPDLFVSYSQSLRTSASKIFNAEYNFTKQWTLLGQVGSTEDSFLDFQFRYPLNAPEYPRAPRGKR